MIDTQVLLWCSTEEQPDSPSKRAVMRDYRRLEADGQLFGASVISAWEVALKLERRKVKFNGDALEWLHDARSIRTLRFLPLTDEAAVRSRVGLADFDHEDPADRFILATALVLDLPLLTTDAKVRAYDAGRSRGLGL